MSLFTWFNFFTDFRLYAPIAILYFASVAHSFALGASIFSITYITAALFDIPTGIFADRFGRKKTMLLGAMMALSYALLYAVGRNYMFLVLGALCEGLSRALYSGNNDALLHNMLSEEGMEHDYHVYSGKLSSVFQVALGVSGLLGAFLVHWSFPLIMWLSVIPQLFCLIIASQIENSKAIQTAQKNMWSDLKEGLSAFIHNPNLRLLSASSIVSFGLGETSYQFQAAFYATLLPVWAIGIAKTLLNVGAAIGFYFSGKVINKFGDKVTLFGGQVYSIISTFIALIVPTVASPFLMASNSFFYGTGSTAQSSLLQKEFTDRQRATMSSMNTFAGSLFFGVYAFFIGSLADHLGPRSALFILEACTLPVLLIMWKLVRLKSSTTHP